MLKLLPLADASVLTPPRRRPAVPAEGGPVVLDMATSAYAWFGVLEAKTAGRQLPQGVAQDKEGQVRRRAGGCGSAADRCCGQFALRSGGGRLLRYIWLSSTNAARRMAC